jgi:hypothetical protein
MMDFLFSETTAAIVIYVIGWFTHCRLALARGWEYRDYDDRLMWNDNFHGDFKMSAYVLSWVWPAVLPYTFVKHKNAHRDAPLFAGRPPKHIRNQIKQAETEKELERVNRILREEGIDVENRTQHYGA